MLCGVPWGQAKVANWSIKNMRVVCALSYGGFLSLLGRSGEGLVIGGLILLVVVVKRSQHD